jgi:hypothetical protein
MEPRFKKIEELLDKLQPYMDEYVHREDGKIIFDIEKIKRDNKELDFPAATTPIMFKKEDRKK